MRILLHQRHELHERFTCHDRICVEHDHVAVTPAPAAEEVSDVTGLLVDRLSAFPVENLSETADLLAQLGPSNLLLDPLIGLVRIAEHEKIEVSQLLGLLHRAENHPQTFKDAAHVLIKRRHDNGRLGQHRLTAVRQRRRDLGAVAATIDHIETYQSRTKPRGDVGKQDYEQAEDQSLKHADALAPKQISHEPSRETREPKDHRKEKEPTSPQPPLVHVFGQIESHGSASRVEKPRQHGGKQQPQQQRA